MRPVYWIVPALLLVVAIIAWQVSRPPEFTVPEHFPAPAPEPAGIPGDTTVATFGNGCFWCTEAVFQQLKGVKTVTSGYTGGSVKNPTYEQVCGGDTGHAEGIQVTFDPKVISYAELLEVFWRSHDPTTLNRQGNDTGTQYRSAIFYHTPRQKELAEAYRVKIDEAHVYSAPVVTEIVPYTEFFPAEGHHQNFYSTNPRQGYCRVIIQPKLDKLQKVFADKWK